MATENRTRPARFNLDEPLFPIDHTHRGLLTLSDMHDLEKEWKAAKVDEWCAVAALTRAASSLRTSMDAPADADIAMVLAVAGWKENARKPRIERAVKAYEAAATRYEEVRVQLADIRRRAYVAPAT